MALKGVIRRMDRVVDKMKDASEKAVYEVSADILQKSNELTPKDKGWLRKSGKVTMSKNIKGPVGTVSYGDSRVDYAERLHEIRYKNYSEPGTSWKYLERPLKANGKKYMDYLKKANRKATR